MSPMTPTGPQKAALDVPAYAQLDADKLPRVSPRAGRGEVGGRDAWDPVAESEFAPTDPISSLCRTFPISSLVLVRGVRAFKYRETWTFHIV